MNEILERYKDLYEEMAKSKDPAKMVAFGDAERWAFKREAEAIAANLLNQNGSRGAHWGYDAFKDAVESLGGKMSEKPYYNSYALWVTANMLYSDHANSVAEDMGYSSPSQVPNEKIALSMYRKAVEKLKDPDRPKFVRGYFEEN